MCNEGRFIGSPGGGVLFISPVPSPDPLPVDASAWTRSSRSNCCSLPPIGCNGSHYLVPAPWPISARNSFINQGRESSNNKVTTITGSACPGMLYDLLLLIPILYLLDCSSCVSIVECVDLNQIGSANFIRIDFNEPLKQHLESAPHPPRFLFCRSSCDVIEEEIPMIKRILIPGLVACGDTERLVIGGG